MSDVLEQSEVDALLAAVDTGQVQKDASPYVFGSRGAARRDVQVYDFKRPERVSREQMRALRALHDGFARSLGTSLSEYLRTSIDISVARVEQVAYGEFIHSLPNPTCFNLLKSDQLDGQLCLEISPLIVYPILDRLLGGGSAEVFIPQRPFTQIERRLVQRITDRATEHLSQAWSKLTAVSFRVHELESDPRMVRIAPSEETVVVVGFELKMANRAGTMSLCMPYNVIEPIMGALAAQDEFGHQRKAPQDDQVRTLTRGVNIAPVEVRAIMAQTSISLNDLLSLQPGDVITTEKPCTCDVLIQVEGRNKFLGQVGQFHGRRSVKVTRICQEAAEGTTEAKSGDRR